MDLSYYLSRLALLFCTNLVSIAGVLFAAIFLVQNDYGNSGGGPGSPVVRGGIAAHLYRPERPQRLPNVEVNQAGLAHEAEDPQLARGSKDAGSLWLHPATPLAPSKLARRVRSIEFGLATRVYGTRLSNHAVLWSPGPRALQHCPKSSAPAIFHKAKAI